MDLVSWWGSLPPVAHIALTAAGTYAAVIVLSRLNGLRSFATMSAFDFVMTIAIGSIMATTILSPSVRFSDGLTALAALFILQRLVALGRRWRMFDQLVDNRPRVLIRSGTIHAENLRRCHMKLEDLHSKIREAGIGRVQDVGLAVMETSGTVSVIRQGNGIDDALCPELR